MSMVTFQHPRTALQGQEEGKTLLFLKEKRGQKRKLGKGRNSLLGYLESHGLDCFYQKVSTCMVRIYMGTTSDHLFHTYCMLGTV